MSEKENKVLGNDENSEDVTKLDEEELGNVVGGSGGINPPRVDVHDYDEDVKKRM